MEHLTNRAAAAAVLALGVGAAVALLATVYTHKRRCALCVACALRRPNLRAMTRLAVPSLRTHGR